MDFHRLVGAKGIVNTPSSVSFFFQSLLFPHTPECIHRFLLLFFENGIIMAVPFHRVHSSAKKRGPTMERWKINLIVLWFGQFLAMSGMSMVMPFLPYYIQELGVKETHQVAVWSSVIFAANFVTSFMFQPIWGGIADRKGRKIMLLRSGFGMALVTGAMGFATLPVHLLFLRLLNGVISGLFLPERPLCQPTHPRKKNRFCARHAAVRGCRRNDYGAAHRRAACAIYRV